MAVKLSSGRKLRNLIATGETILIPGAHDPLIGRIVQRLGFKACMCAGWMTGAHIVTPEPVMTMTEQVEVARKVAQAVDIPVISDAATGYGDAIHVMRTVKEFERAGIAMIHIEDQFFPKRASYHRGLEHIVSLDDFLHRMDFALKAREDPDLMIFGRTDAGNAVNGSWKEAARRTRALKELGVDGVLPMCRTKESMEQFRQEYPDNDVVFLATTYFNGLHKDEIRKYGFQLIAYPLATMVASASAILDLYQVVLKTGIAKYDPKKAKAVREEIENAIGLPEFWEIEKETVEAAQRSWIGRQVAGYEAYDQKRK